MKIEWVIYFLMAVCVCMVAFNLVFVLWERLRLSAGAWRASRIERLLFQAIELSEDAGIEKHIDMLARKLGSLRWLEAYDCALRELQVRDAAALEEYLAVAAPIFPRLVPAYRSKDDLHRAFFADMVEKWYRARPASTALITVLQGWAERGSFYQRQNALEAISAVGSAHELAAAFAAMDRAQEFNHPKLLTEVALAFNGNSNHLAVELVGAFDGMSAAAQTAVVNYLRMSGAVAAPNRDLGDGGTRFRSPRRAQESWIVDLLGDGQRDRELRLACLRYVGSHPCRRAYPVLLDLAGNEDEGAWEFAAVACSVLASYPSAQTVKVLKGCLSSRVWYVRSNAAASLYTLGASLDADLGDVLVGSDAYARDMILHRWEQESREGGAR